jgi:N4-(beta-N-acetylglucosaminyl)-L-asparaginase
MKRRDFVRTGAGAAAALATAPAALAASSAPSPGRPPEVLLRRAVRPVVISDISGARFRNGGPECALERAFRGITSGEDVLDALVAGVNIPELDPEETGIGYGGLPNGEGIVQLDASVMHGPRRWAGAVAGIEGVRTPSRVAQAVAEFTDHHLLAGEGARLFARQLGFEVEDDLNTPRSRELWLNWKRRVDSSRWLEPNARLRGQGILEETDPDLIGGRGRPPGGQELQEIRQEARARADAWYRAGLEVVAEGLIPAHSFWGTINCNGITPEGDIAGVTTTSGLAWKIPGRIGDSPILGAGLYVDNDVGAAGSTGRGEANLFNLSSFLIVEFLRQGMHPKDAGMAALERIRQNTVEGRLLREDGTPDFDIRFFILDKAGEYAGVAMRGTGESNYAVCDENGLREVELESLLGRG